MTKLKTQPKLEKFLCDPREVEEKSDNNKNKNIEKDFSKLSPIIKCYKCQVYGHVAANCPDPVKIAKVREPPVTNSEPLPPLLPIPPSSLPPLDIIVPYSSTTLVGSCCQPLPPLLSTPSPSLILALLLRTPMVNYIRAYKSTLSFVSTKSASSFASNESELSLASHMHVESHHKLYKSIITWFKATPTTSYELMLGNNLKF